MHRITVIISALTEAGNIQRLVQEVLAAALVQVIVGQQREIVRLCRGDLVYRGHGVCSV